MSHPKVDWLRLSPRWTALLTPDRQRALSSLSEADQEEFFAGVVESLSLTDADRKAFFGPPKESAPPGQARDKFVEKFFDAANHHFDQMAAKRGLKVPETVMLG
jgi:hypothetical protein